MNSFMCLDCSARIEIIPPDEGDPTCPNCGTSNLVEVFGVLSQQAGPA
jgi:DNA-directed RNA polymerase subunit RPC12/RpoP